MARRFHNDAVIDVRRVRRKTVVRVFRLAGHAELPATIEFDDELPRASGLTASRGPHGLAEVTLVERLTPPLDRATPCCAGPAGRSDRGARRPPRLTTMEG